MGKSFLYLDTFALVRVASDAALASSARNYFATNDFFLTISAMNLMELVSWPKRWSEVVSFVSSVPFCVAQNVDEIAAAEVACYPNELASLPLGFCSLDHSFSADALSNALALHLQGKVSEFARVYRAGYREVLEVILEKRKSFPPDSPARYSRVEREMFMQSSVLSVLFPVHGDFLARALAEARAAGGNEGINIARFKSVYIQALAIFVEYYVQKKAGKPSDLGDILQLGLLPYVDIAVLDNERCNLIHRFNREKLFPGFLRACNLSEFKATIGA